METGLSTALAAILAKHGKRWEIGRDRETGTWVAIERPRYPVHFVMAHALARTDEDELDSLDEKLDQIAAEEAAPAATLDDLDDAQGEGQ